MNRRNGYFFLGHICLFLLIFAGSAQATDYLVSGAGNSAVNGTFVENGTHGTQPLYVYNGYYLYYEYSTHWIDNDENSGNGALYYNGTYSAATPAGTNWKVWSGASPAPTVAVAPSASSPTATTNAASSVTASGATLNGAVNANGASATVTFEYGLTTAYGSSVTADESPVTGTTSSSVSKAITGLTPGVTYHYRVVAQNSQGTTNGSDQTFITDAASPTATTNAASSVTANGATLNGAVNANGASTTVTFEYGLTTGYGSSVAANESPVTGTTSSSVSKAITGLTPGVTYHYRVVAQNSQGTTNGSDMTFATVSMPSTPSELIAAAMSQTQIDLTWDGTSEKFRVLQKTDSSSASENDGNIIYAGVNKSFSVTGLDTNTTYFFTVYGMNTAGDMFSSGNQKAVASTLPAADSTRSNAECGFLAGDADSTYTLDSLGVDVFFTDATDSDGFLEIVRHGVAPQYGVLPASAEIPAGGTIVPTIIYEVHYWQVVNHGLKNFVYKIILSLDGISGIGDPARLCVYKRETSGAAWTDAAADAATIEYDSDLNALIISGLTTFSEFAIGSDGGDNPLPVEFSAFSGAVSTAGVVLNWKTASETNNAGFVLYRNNVEIASYKNVSALQGQGTKGSATTYSFTDEEVYLGETYTYKIASEDYSGVKHEYEKVVSVSITESAKNESTEVYEYALAQNYPNPFNPSTTICFSLKYAGTAILKVFDMLGKEVGAAQIQGNAGWNSYTFSAKALSSGMYYYQVISGSFTETKKMMLLK
ncbi:Fibronectin type III domain protein [Chloroherpeton thalassium ATCC 35110]|uniref:Fibronectin type III domain protein n=1 Tax=Chloroherpeton thalassium (strain ATCC 35110 / GB-78) TaxID=517418 RepID=B3QRT2_CHLT3|nr:T9SS type A sorting domain-containing protein [Chloroherpeton thalassium]ACF13885.1 Fibronectin type III domain protein [Chloroherpeton thalassium ATCC 35110]